MLAGMLEVVVMPNPYPQSFLELYTALSPCIAADLGSGKRSMPGLISMDYLHHPDSSLQGDVLCLPFKDDGIDLILSQATLEHVTNPDLAMQEMFRVLKPGGILYVEIAFMQPVHLAPHHYFNVTPYGLTWMLRDWDVIDQGTLGTFQQVMDELCKEVGFVTPSNHTRRIRYPDQYPAVAYGVYAAARKPVT